MGGGCPCCHPYYSPARTINASRGAVQFPASPADTRLALQDLDVITAVRGARSGQATYIAKTLFRHFQTDLRMESCPWSSCSWTRDGTLEITSGRG